METNGPTKREIVSAEILIAEFEYAAQTAFQAGEDRSRVSNFYYVTAGAAIGAILSAKLEPAGLPGVYTAFAGLFLVLTGIGTLTLLQLARLRTAWEDSARAMNTIKDYYCKHVTELDLAPAFLWKMQTIPMKDDKRTISSLLALSILAITWGTASAAVVYLLLIPFAINQKALELGHSIFVAAIGLTVGWLVVYIEYQLYKNWIAEARLKKNKEMKKHYDNHPNDLPELPDQCPN